MVGIGWGGCWMGIFYVRFLSEKRLFINIVQSILFGIVMCAVSVIYWL